MSHEVRVKIDNAVIAHKDFEVNIKSGEGKIGKILISRGNIEWLPKGNSINKRKLTWAKFAEIMQTYGDLSKKSKS